MKGTPSKFSTRSLLTRKNYSQIKFPSSQPLFKLTPPSKFNKYRNPPPILTFTAHKHTVAPAAPSAKDHPTRSPPPLPCTHELKQNYPLRREDWYHSNEVNQFDPLLFDNYDANNVKNVIKEAQENIRDTYADYYKSGGGELELGEHVRTSPRGQELDWDDPELGRALLRHLHDSDTVSLPHSPPSPPLLPL